MNANINNTISVCEMFADLESLIDNGETLHQCWLNDVLSSASLNWEGVGVGGGGYDAQHMFLGGQKLGRPQICHSKMLDSVLRWTHPEQVTGSLFAPRTISVLTNIPVKSLPSSLPPFLARSPVLLLFSPRWRMKCSYDPAAVPGQGSCCHASVGSMHAASD